MRKARERAYPTFSVSQRVSPLRRRPKGFPVALWKPSGPLQQKGICSKEDFVAKRNFAVKRDFAAKGILQQRGFCSKGDFAAKGILQKKGFCSKGDFAAKGILQQRGFCSKEKFCSIGKSFSRNRSLMESKAKAFLAPQQGKPLPGKTACPQHGPAHSSPVPMAPFSMAARKSR